MDKGLQFVGFQIGREMFGLPISSIREIVRVPEITSVPNAPSFVEGVIHLRGRIIPVVDFCKRFGGKNAERSRSNRVVVAEMEGRAIGLIVNSVSEVLRFSPSEIESPQNVFPEGDPSYISGIGKSKGQLVILLDLSRLLERGELWSLGEIAESVPAVPVASAARYL